MSGRTGIGAVEMRKAGPHTLGGTAVLGVIVVLSLISISIARHPTSIQEAGKGLLVIDVSLLLAYGIAAIWAWRQRGPEVGAALSVGAQFGLLLGAVRIANHVIESFAHIKNGTLQLALGAGPVLLMLAFFGAAGSVAWGRTRSFVLAFAAGAWCAVVGALITLAFGLAFNLVFEARLELRLQEAFAASGMNDSGAFLVRNSLEAASEALVRMPVFAVFLSLIGIFENAKITRLSRRAVLLSAWLAPFIFVAGAAALSHADSLERAARPPFVMAGVLLAGVALCAVHPIWSALRRPTR